MKFGRKIFFISGLYNCPGTFVKPFRDLPHSFHEILIIIFRLLVLNIFGIIRAEMMKCGQQIFFTRELYSSPGTFPRPFRDLPDNFYGVLVKISGTLVLIIFDIFHAKMIKYGQKYFPLDGFTVVPGPSWGLSGIPLTVFIKYRS